MPLSPLNTIRFLDAMPETVHIYFSSRRVEKTEQLSLANYPDKLCMRWATCEMENTWINTPELVLVFLLQNLSTPLESFINNFVSLF